MLVPMSATAVTPFLISSSCASCSATSRSVARGGGREAAEAPGLLVPAAPDDPRPLGIGGGVFGDLRLSFGQRAGARQVDRQEAEPEAHHVGMRVDQAGNDRAAAAVLAEIGARRALPSLHELANLAVVVDQHRTEAGDRAVAVDREAVDVVDQGVGERGGGQGDEESGENPHAPTSGKWRISALVSCRPPPMAWTSA